MATVNDAVSRLSFQATDTGIDQVTAKLTKLGGTQDNIAVSAVNAEKATALYQARLASNQAQIDAILKQQDQYNKLLAANSAALTASAQAANDNGRSVSESGLEWATWAEHAKTAGEAAYALSPKFRGLIASLGGPALEAATTAIELAATGIVTGTNLAGKGLVELGVGIARSSSTLAPFAEQMAMTGAAMAGWSPTITGIAGSILGKLLPAFTLFFNILAPILLIKDGIELVAQAWELGGQKLDGYRAIAEKAAAVDLNVTYFQKLMKGAEDSKVPVDQLTTALQNLQKASADQLGGSALQQRLDASTKAGNFANNPGVSQLAQANTLQEKFAAITVLVHQAMQDGQRLAAIDITNTAFGPQMADNLRNDSEYFDKITAAAAKVSDTQLVSPEDIGRALDLKNRYDAAVTILEQRWHPIQDLLADQGIKMQAAWVGIVESIAAGFDWVTKLVLKINEIPQTFWDYAKTGVHAAATGVAAVAPALGPPGAAVGAVAGIVADATATDPTKDATAYGAAVDKLRAGLQNQAEQQAKVNEANTIAQKTLGDTSHAIDGAKTALDGQRDAYDRAVSASEKHTAQLIAETAAIGLGVGATEEYKTAATLKAAADQAGTEITQKVLDQMQDLAQDAGDAKQAYAEQQAAAKANFDLQTAGLTGVEAQIAQVNYQLHGNNWKDFQNDGLAATMRLADSAKTLSDAFSSFSTSFVQGILQGKGAADALASSLQSVGSSLASVGTKSLTSSLTNGLKTGTFSFDPVSLAIGGAGAVISLVGNLFGSSSKAQQQLEAAQKTWLQAGPAFQTFITQMTGGVQGDLSQQFDQALQNYNDLATKAWNAKDFGAVAQLQSAYNQDRLRDSKNFVTTFNATLEGLADGLGPNSPFLTAVNNVKTQLQSVQGIIDDANSAFSTLNGIDINAAYVTGSAGADPESAAQFAAIQSQVGAATAAAATYLITLLKTPPVLDTVQTALMNLNGTSTALQGALVQLGLSSQAAADAISSGVSAALDQIKTTFEASLTARLNTANGQDYLNDATTLITQHTQDLQDAASLNIDPGQVAAVFQAEAQKIVDDAGLVGDAFSAFILQFPQLADVVHQSSATLAQAASDQATAAAQAAAAIQQSLQSTQQFIDQTGKQISDYLNGLKTGASSTLSPQDQLNAAQTQFNQQLALAQAGDRTALGTITQYSQTLLDSAKSFFGSSTGYSDVFNSVTQALQTIPDNLTVSQVTAADQIVAAIQDAKAATVTNLQSGTLQTIAAQYANSTIVTDKFTLSNGLTVDAITGMSAQQIAAMYGSTGQVSETVTLANGQTVSALYDTNGQLINTTVSQTGATTGAVNAASASNDNFLSAQNSLTTAQSAIITATNTLAQSQVSLLSSIQGIQSSSQAQLTLLNNQLTNVGASSPLTQVVSGNSVSTIFTSNNNLLTALNKIVANTFATAGNTYALVQSNSSSSQITHYQGTLATGGWITGGTPGRDSVLLADRSTLGMPGEFVLNYGVAQANKSWLPEFNETGRLPALAISAPFVAPIAPSSSAPGNDNREFFAMLAKTNAAGFSAICDRLERLEATYQTGSRDIAKATAKTAPKVRPGKAA